ncbi:MAG: metallophosphoesterase [Sphingomonadaceae bacterium]|nr:metallophosphoesterase [Sphingomonadaceae bacterium]
MRIAAVVALGLAGLSAIVGGWRGATARPRVVRYDVAVRGWSGPPLRLVQVSDIHMGPPDMPAARVADIVAEVDALRPDIIVLTGDYHGGKFLDGDAGNLDDGVRPLRRLHAPLGVFAVRGNHDDPYWTPRVLPRYRMTYLENAHADAGPVTVAGIDDAETGHPDIAAALAGAPPGKPVLLLMHEPDRFAAVPRGVALTLAGHTHGGQIRLPLIGAIVTHTDFGWVRGRYDQGGRTLIVSSGVGTSGVPLRLGVPPEIVVVTLH